MNEILNWKCSSCGSIVVESEVEKLRHNDPSVVVHKKCRGYCYINQTARR
jgi:hypothetical protein